MGAAGTAAAAGAAKPAGGAVTAGVAGGSGASGTVNAAAALGKVRLSATLCVLLSLWVDAPVFPSLPCHLLGIFEPV